MSRSPSRLDVALDLFQLLLVVDLLLLLLQELNFFSLISAA